MDKLNFIRQHLTCEQPAVERATAFAPSNIALVKYWGKRDVNFNLPLTDSLSISLGDKGTTTTVSVATEGDQLFINDNEITHDSPAYLRLQKYLDLFRPSADFYFKVESQSSVPIGCGLASSACGFAALVLALKEFFAWPDDKPLLSAIARMGSGSAARSLWHGFVHWQRGERMDGLDSVAHPLKTQWPELRVGLLIHHLQEKSTSSTDGMVHTAETSPFYNAWPEVVNQDLAQLQQAITEKNFEELGQISEYNAQTMHALMQSARPPVIYSNANTLALIEQVRILRAEGVPVYFTQDAGPNIKLLFEQSNESAIKTVFKNLTVVAPFKYVE